MHVSFATSHADGLALLVLLLYKEEAVGLALNLQRWDSSLAKGC